LQVVVVSSGTAKAQHLPVQLPMFDPGHMTALLSAAREVELVLSPSDSRSLSPSACSQGSEIPQATAASSTVVGVSQSPHLDYDEAAPLFMRSPSFSPNPNIQSPVGDCDLAVKDDIKGVRDDVAQDPEEPGLDPLLCMFQLPRQMAALVLSSGNNGSMPLLAYHVGVDTCATRHVCPDVGLMRDMSLATSGSTVLQTVSQELVPVLGTGTMMLNLLARRDDSQPLQLVQFLFEGTLFVPCVQSPIISVGDMCYQHGDVLKPTGNYVCAGGSSSYMMISGWRIPMTVLSSNLFAVVAHV